MVWACVSVHDTSNLHISEGTIIAELYIKVSEQHMLSFRQRNSIIMDVVKALHMSSLKENLMQIN